MSRLKDRSGEIYNKLTIIRFHGRRNGQIYWECKCECGNKTISSYGNLSSGNKKSCGCLIRDSKRNAKTASTHGLSKTRFYTIWKGMKYRTSENVSPNSAHFEQYLERGIIMSERWNDFINFKDDMYESYLEHISKHGEENTSIDRINVNKGYAPDNCRWATWSVQGNNRTNNKYVFYKGEEYTMSALAKKHGISPGLFNSRLHRGWGIEKSLKTKPHKSWVK